MRTALLLLGLALFCSAAQAEKIFRWVGADNKVHYGDTPPMGARDVRTFDRKVGTSSAIATAASAAPPDAGAQAAREADCARKQSQLASYRSATRLVERDSLGREREYSEEERAELVALTESQLAEQCAGIEIAEDTSTP